MSWSPFKEFFMIFGRESYRNMALLNFSILGVIYGPVLKVLNNYFSYIFEINVNKNTVPLVVVTVVDRHVSGLCSLEW